MIRSLAGTILSFFPQGLVLDVHDVGYEVFVPDSFIQSARVGQSVRLDIYTHVKEDALQLYGFPNTDDRTWFIQLLGVSGVGPRTALGVMSRGTDALLTALKQADIGFFQSIPRLGKKTAQKIVVDLQPKVGSEYAVTSALPTNLAADIYDAVVGMGYNETRVRELVAEIDPELSEAEALKWVLAQVKKPQS